jgi:hypothetical protein
MSVQRKDGSVQTKFSFPERIFYARQLGLKIEKILAKRSLVIP